MINLKKNMKSYLVMIFVITCAIIGMQLLFIHNSKIATKRLRITDQSFTEYFINSSLVFTRVEPGNYLQSTANPTTVRSLSTTSSAQFGVNIKVIDLKPKIKFFNSKLGINSECNRQQCKHSSDLKWKMFTFVKSHADNFHRRQIIRRTWGSVFHLNGSELSTVFVVGKAGNRSQKLIDEEYKRFGDILQIDEDDGYQNVPMKSLAGMQWASENLLDDVYYSSCDDDMTVDIGRLQEEIDKARDQVSKNDWPEFPIICGYDIWNNPGGPIRIEKHKNYVSKDKYKWPKWPKFCLGGFYTTSVGVAKQLYRIARTRNMINTDDVWITGILRNILGMPDMMLIKLNPGLAGHQGNRINKISMEVWKNTYNKYKSKNMCTC